MRQAGMQVGAETRKRRVTQEQAVALRELLEVTADLSRGELVALIPVARLYSAREPGRGAWWPCRASGRTHRAVHAQACECLNLLIGACVAAAATLATLLGRRALVQRLRLMVDVARVMAAAWAAECERYG